MWAWNKVELKTWKVFNVCTTLKNSIWRTAPRDLENSKIWLFFCTWIFQVTKELIANSSPEVQIQVSPGQESLQKNTLNFNCHFPLPFSLLSQLFRSLPHFGVKNCLHCSFLNIPQPLILLLCSRSLYNELRNSRSFFFSIIRALWMEVWQSHLFYTCKAWWFSKSWWIETSILLHCIITDHTQMNGALNCRVLIISYEKQTNIVGRWLTPNPYFEVLSCNETTCGYKAFRCS